MYREMTDKEKLDFTSEIITAMQYGGFSAVLKLIEEKKEELDDNNTVKEPKKELEDNNEEKLDKDFFIEEIKDENEIKKEEPEEVELEDDTSLLSSDGASIYSKEALPLVKKDLEDQKNKLLSNEEAIVEENEINEELPVETEETIEENKVLSNDEYIDEEPVIEESFVKAPVLERKLTNNNPWSGIETVAPGTLKL